MGESGARDRRPSLPMGKRTVGTRRAAVRGGMERDRAGRCASARRESIWRVRHGGNAWEWVSSAYRSYPYRAATDEKIRRRCSARHARRRARLARDRDHHDPARRTSRGRHAAAITTSGSGARDDALVGLHNGDLLSRGSAARTISGAYRSLRRSRRRNCERQRRSRHDLTTRREGDRSDQGKPEAAHASLHDTRQMKREDVLQQCPLLPVAARRSP